MKKGNDDDLTFRKEFEENMQIKKFGKSALALFVLLNYLRIDDIEDFAANSITDGGDDKKIDICYISEESGRLIIAQDYFCENWDKKSAPSNKASDLNTAIAWLFSSRLDEVPIGLRAKVVEVRGLISQNKIHQIEIHYIHNCPESKNVHRELQTCSNLIDDLLNKKSDTDQPSIEIMHIEFGLKTIERMFQSTESQILIDKWISVPVKKGEYIIEKTEKWESILTTVPAKWVRTLYLEYLNDLFSANYREYLGYSRSEKNINNKIVTTANTEPQNFWVFNNGITALTKIIDFNKRTKRIRGISVINGAQTSGALGSSNEESVEKARVLIRFVKCLDPELVDSIIQYNNTQNEIKPEDTRSKDDVQKAIRNDFEKYGIPYVYRRSDKRNSSLSITGKSIAAILCSFHGDPDTAYRSPTEIFKNDEVYERVFNKTIKVEHIFLVRSLSLAIDKIKLDIKEKYSNEQATGIEIDLYNLIKYSSSKHFLMFLFGYIREEIMNTRITDTFSWRAKSEYISPTNDEIINAWVITARTLLPYVTNTMKKKDGDPYYEIPQSSKLTREFSQELRVIVSSLEDTIGKQLKDIRRKTEV